MANRWVIMGFPSKTADNECDRLAAEIEGHPVGVGRNPARLMARAAQEIAGLILDAGYRKSRTVTTQAELDSLPEGAVIRDPLGLPLMRKDQRWNYGRDCIQCAEVRLPVMVLWESEENDKNGQH